MWPTIIAVLGTLAGGALAGVTQHWTARSARQEQHRLQVADAVRALLAAALTYRERFWLQIEVIRDGEQETPEARADRYRARSEVTIARDHLVLLTNDPALIAAARDASWSAISLSDVPLGPVEARRFADDVEAQLEAARDESRDTHTTLRDTGVAYVHGSAAAPGADQRSHMPLPPGRAAESAAAPAAPRRPGN
ncbi:hypothetical protein ACFXAZ_33370 [Streptomyces sp. NPDC059477]|uniref:hypothetical protein n=1 Tax=Streptomyces sp. NPDC059477 TaxID=3346847 RepID=UPI0036B048E3